MTKRNPVVSIITPFLNAAEFFEESINSALWQTYAHWELLLIDDGSTDGSTEIARRYAGKFPDKIRYFEHEGHQNLGGSASRNVGIRHAVGDFIAFLDADDVYLPNKLEEQVPILMSQPTAAMMYAATLYWHGWTGKPEDAACDWMWSNFGVEANAEVAPPRLLVTYLRDGRTLPVPCSLLVRREALERVGGFEDAFVNQYDDQVMFAKICLESPVFISSECWDKYRQHPNSSCHIAKQTGEADRARLAYLEWLEGYLKAKDISHAELWSALRRALRPYRYPALNRIAKRTEHFKGKLISSGGSAARRVLPEAVWRRVRSLRS